MDIANIRKKAKTNKPDEPDTVEPSGLVIDDLPDPGSESGLIIDDEPVDVPETPVEQAPIETVAPVSNADALDKLFDDDTSQMFATEESYNQVLSKDSDEIRLDIKQYLAFNLGSEEYALDITKISEIIKVRELTDIPRVPEYILGIISLRGVVVPVFDLNRRFRLGETSVTASSRIVVCSDDDVQAGLLVDSINQVINLNEENIEPPPAILTGIDRDLVEGVGRYQGRMIILLHLKSVLDIELT